MFASHHYLTASPCGPQTYFVASIQSQALNRCIELVTALASPLKKTWQRVYVPASVLVPIVDLT